MPIKDAALFAAQHGIFAIQMVRGWNFGVNVQETCHINPCSQFKCSFGKSYQLSSLYDSMSVVQTHTQTVSQPLTSLTVSKSLSIPIITSQPLKTSAKEENQVQLAVSSVCECESVRGLE